ncbi:MAG: hypothetical protein QF473_18495, partial [Planctomycetota bacterium]|nr:hypothetical protein [Planctomycetota bacterium]
MFSINGCGLSVCGNRDYDAETGTYIKTHCICLVFIPVLALGAYRVADAETGGWYFIGKVPLSVFARFWNMLIFGGIALSIGIGAWQEHSNSPAYRAKQKLAQAESAFSAGKIEEAIPAYREVATGRTQYAKVAAGKLKGMLDERGQDGDAKTVNALFKAAVALSRRGSWPASPNELVQQCKGLVAARGKSDPSGAMQLLSIIDPLVVKKEEWAELRVQLLHALVKREPDNPAHAASLAAVYESKGDMKKCIELLTPHKDRLGITEGARILGQHFAHEGNYEDSYKLLGPYTEGRLKNLHEAEKAYNAALQGAQERALNELKQGSAHYTFYDKYDRADDQTKQQLVSDHISASIANDPTAKDARDRFMQDTGIVPVALDLGIVLLRRAQGMTDKKSREAELQKAEKTFLSIQGVAGGSMQFKLYLGQVYYWLGKEEEGKKQFDALLAEQKRTTEILLALAKVMREVGNRSQAGAYSEEAYEKETDEHKKRDAAMLRSLCATEEDEESKWLERANDNSPNVQASIAYAKGRRALRQSNEAEAANHLRTTVQLYTKLPENASSLNNSALAYQLLFRATGEAADFKKAAEQIGKAAKLHASDSILLSNASGIFAEEAWLEVLKDQIDFRILKTSPSAGFLSFMYKTPEKKQEYIDRYFNQPRAQEASALKEKVLLLSPKSPGTYGELASMHVFKNDVPALRELLARLKSVQLDLKQSNQYVVDFYAGKHDKKRKKNQRASAERFEK